MGLKLFIPFIFLFFPPFFPFFVPLPSLPFLQPQEPPGQGQVGGWPCPPPPPTSLPPAPSLGGTLGFAAGGPARASDGLTEPYNRLSPRR